MDIVERVKVKAKEKGLSIRALEENLGIGNGTIGKWNKQAARADSLITVASYLQVSIDWLLLGKEIGELTIEEQRLLKAYRIAAPAMQEAARKILDVEALPGKSSTSEPGEEAI